LLCSLLRVNVGCQVRLVRSCARSAGKMSPTLAQRSPPWRFRFQPLAVAARLLLVVNRSIPAAFMRPTTWACSWRTLYITTSKVAAAASSCHAHGPVCTPGPRASVTGPGTAARCGWTISLATRISTRRRPSCPHGHACATAGARPPACHLLSAASVRAPTVTASGKFDASGLRLPGGLREKEVRA
jgi:hypothetical protein